MPAWLCQAGGSPALSSTLPSVAVCGGAGGRSLCWSNVRTGSAGAAPGHARIAPSAASAIYRDRIETSPYDIIASILLAPRRPRDQALLVNVVFQFCDSLSGWRDRFAASETQRPFDPA
jgi:hypothetical protein